MVGVCVVGEIWKEVLFRSIQGKKLYFCRYLRTLHSSTSVSLLFVGMSVCLLGAVRNYR